KTSESPKPDCVSEERREEREEQDGQPATEPHRREVSDELGKGERYERKQEDGPAQGGPGDQGGRRISNERSLTEDRIEGGKDGRRDDGQRSLGGLEPELASRVGEGDHQAESAKREGDGRGLEGADLLLEERDRQHRDERRSRGDDERRGPRGHRRVGFTEVQKEVVPGEADKREEGQPGEVRPTRGGPELAPRRKGTDEQQGGNREAQERQGDPRHVHEGLLDRDEREPPDQDQEEHRAVDGPARAEPLLQRYAAGTWAGDKKVRAAIAGARVGNRLHGVICRSSGLGATGGRQEESLAILPRKGWAPPQDLRCVSSTPSALARASPDCRNTGSARSLSRRRTSCDSRIGRNPSSPAVDARTRSPSRPRSARR